MNIKKTSEKAYTFIELAVVITIIGLIVGGVIAAQSLIKATTLNSVGNDLAYFSSAMSNFKDKYRKLPGDMDDASRFWGLHGTCNSVGLAAQATCNGNADGRIASVAGFTREHLYVWHHLNNAGMLSNYAVTNFGNYQTLTSATPALIPKYNVPASKFDGGGYSIEYFDGQAFWPWTAGPYPVWMRATLISFGSQGFRGYMQGQILLPEEAQSIDAKLDDGLIAAGKIVGSAGATNCAETGAPGTYMYGNTNITYNVDTRTPICYIAYVFE